MLPKIPGSKSILQRIMVLAAHARADIRLENYNPCADVVELESAMKTFGYHVEKKQDGMHFHFNENAHLASSHKYQFQESATAFRLWLSVLANLKGTKSYIAISDILQKRGYTPLRNALESMGAAFSPNENILTIDSSCLNGGKVDLRDSISSQFASSLVLAAPYMQNDLWLRRDQYQVSLPYLQLSLQMLKTFGAEIMEEGDYLRVLRGKYSLPRHFTVDSDISTAAFYAALGAVQPEGVRMQLQINPEYPQADMAIFPILTQMGAQVDWSGSVCNIKPGRMKAVDLDLRDCPDLMPILSILALFCDGKTVLRGIARLKHKESDRVLGIARVLDLIGVAYVLNEDYLELYPIGNRELPAVQLDTQNDHRLVMAFSLLWKRYVQISLKETASLAKSIPGAELDK